MPGIINDIIEEKNGIAWLDFCGGFSLLKFIYYYYASARIKHISGEPTIIEQWLFE